MAEAGHTAVTPEKVLSGLLPDNTFSFSTTHTILKLLCYISFQHLESVRSFAVASFSIPETTAKFASTFQHYAEFFYLKSRDGKSSPCKTFSPEGFGLFIAFSRDNGSGLPGFIEPRFRASKFRLISSFRLKHDLTTT